MTQSHCRRNRWLSILLSGRRQEEGGVVSRIDRQAGLRLFSKILNPDHHGPKLNKDGARFEVEFLTRLLCGVPGPLRGPEVADRNVFGELQTKPFEAREDKVVQPSRRPSQQAADCKSFSSDGILPVVHPGSRPTDHHEISLVYHLFPQLHRSREGPLVIASLFPQQLVANPSRGMYKRGWLGNKNPDHGSRWL